MADLAEGKLTAVVATTALIAEGFDVPALSGLFLATPMSYAGRVVQAIGRVSRSAPGKRDALVTDYCDDNRMRWHTWKNRKRVYVEQGCTVTWAPATPQRKSA